MNALMPVALENPMVLQIRKGVSDDAQKIREQADKLQQIFFTRTISYGERLSLILEALLRVRQDYSEDNWDGYGAKSIDSRSFENALGFALSIPSSIPTPDIDVIPTGQVVFTWYKGKRLSFSVIIGSRNELSYAGLYGAAKAYGTEYFTDYIPDTILKNISRIYP